jgi:hypothetical protein
VVGVGVRLPPNRLTLFEALVNAIHRAAPQTAIAFNTRPRTAARRLRAGSDGLAPFRTNTETPGEYVRRAEPHQSPCKYRVRTLLKLVVHRDPATHGPSSHRQPKYGQNSAAPGRSLLDSVGLGLASEPPANTAESRENSVSSRC